MRTWAARIVALCALAGAAIAVVIAVASFQGTKSTSQTDVNEAVAQLSAANQKLSSELAALTPGASPHAAQLVNRATQATAKRMLGQFDAGDDLGRRMRSLLTAELDYLDAVGSSVANPHSALLGRVVSRAAALRSALDATPGADAADVRGDRNLVAYSTARGRG